MTPRFLVVVCRCVKLLVQHHARIDALNDEMATPLHIAAAYNHKDVVDFLIEM